MVMVMYMEGSMWYLKVCHMLAAAEVRGACLLRVLL